MRVWINTSALLQSRWYGYLTRFLFGGAITVLTGVIAKRYGPVIGGLFLAFPAVFPASAVLIDRYETQKKARAGFHDQSRGRLAVALEARGAALGALALGVFALVVWRALPEHNAAVVLAVAAALWFTLAAVSWRLRKALG